MFLSGPPLLTQVVSSTLTPSACGKKRSQPFFPFFFTDVRRWALSGFFAVLRLIIVGRAPDGGLCPRALGLYSLQGWVPKWVVWFETNVTSIIILILANVAPYGGVYSNLGKIPNPGITRNPEKSEKKRPFSPLSCGVSEIFPRPSRRNHELHP